MSRVDVDGFMRTLLIIDDQPSVLQTLDYVFSLHGYRTLLASSGEAGLELAANQSFDAALVDLHMPGMDGLSVCRGLRERAIAARSDARVWMMTAAHTSAMVTKAAEAGAIELLKKPLIVRRSFKRWKITAVGGGRSRRWCRRARRRALTNASRPAEFESAQRGSKPAAADR